VRTTLVLDGSSTRVAGEATEVGRALAEIFERVRTAIGEDRPVVVRVDAEDLLGHQGPERAAYVNAIIGIARAVAFEGASKGWRINVVAAPRESLVTTDQVLDLVGNPSMTGQVVTLGSGLVGRVSP
jgi:NAD(P)-dependent dehydrogenase (short-subunit alcohol dehydrogenase family)